MTTPQVMLEELFRAKLDDLRSIAAAYDVQRSGGVDLLRARLIQPLNHLRAARPPTATWRGNVHRPDRVRERSMARG